MPRKRFGGYSNIRGNISNCCSLEAFLWSFRHSGWHACLCYREILSIKWTTNKHLRIWEESLFYSQDLEFLWLSFQLYEDTLLTFSDSGSYSIWDANYLKVWFRRTLVTTIKIKQALWFHVWRAILEWLKVLQLMT